ncbi:MAG: DNA translocase FtsK 4TM domain-containing protein [Alphaproteobacteria bacterium]
MSRSRTIYRSRRKKRSIFRLPDSMQAFLARRLLDIFAGTLGALGLFLLIALASYDHTDPSSNTAGKVASGPVNNWMGAPGAWLSDLLLQTIGIGGFVFAAGLLVWSARVFRREILRPIWLRVIALLLAAVALPVAAAQISSQGWMVHPFLGSSAGTLILDRLSDFGTGFAPFMDHSFFVIAASVLTAASFLFSVAVTAPELGAAFHGIKNFAIALALFAWTATANFVDWVMHYNDPSYRPRPLRHFQFLMPSEKSKSRRAPAINTGEMLDEEEDDEYAEEEEEEIGTFDKPERTVRTLAQAVTGPAPPAIPVVAKKMKKSSGATQRRMSFTAGDWELPPLTLIQSPPKENIQQNLNEDALRKNAELLQNVLADFNVQGDIVSISPGPVVTLYELEPAPGTKTSRVISLADDIARSMSAVSVRCATVPGRNVIGIELPNKERQIVYMQELLSSRTYESGTAKLPLILGKDIAGQPILADLAKMPHLLVAGTTGSGKSVAVNTMILSLLYRLSPEQCRFIMIDPKMLELSVYQDIPHLLSPVVTEPGKAVVALKWTVREMEDRYRAMSKLGVRNIDGYNERVREARKKGETINRQVQTGFDPGTGKPIFEEQPLDLSDLPYIVVIVDEFADLMLVAGKDVENAIQRLAQMARAAGIHLIMATQRPSVDVITGVIKANFPTRISFQVTSKIDSRTILGESGAEQLLGMGDMLYMAPGGRITRVHGPFVSDNEVEQVVDFLKDQGEPDYVTEVTDGDDDFGDSEVMNAMFGGGDSDVDELYDQAVALVAREGKASTSFVQRYLQIGYNRAARIIEEMERQGVISKPNATGKREVLVGNHYSDA